MKFEREFYSRKLISNLNYQRKKKNLEINPNIIFSNEIGKYKNKINRIYSKCVKAKINTKHTLYSRQLSQYNLQYKKLNEKNLKEENEKYLKRVFSYEKSFISTNRTSKKIIILPSIEAKCSTTKKDFSDFYDKNFNISSPKIKFLNSKKAEKRD